MEENQLPALSVFDADGNNDETKNSANRVKETQSSEQNMTTNLSKSTNNLPPFSQSGRVAKIKTAMAAKDDDFERAQDSKIGVFHT